MKKYRDIFFDLDRTLWDFDTNSRKALEIIFAEESLESSEIPGFSAFYEKYVGINDELWAHYRRGHLTKEELQFRRFDMALRSFGITDLQLANRISDAYVDLSPRLTELIDGAIEILHYLHGRYKLHIITNGFPEVQHIKLKNSGLKEKFERILISEEVGASKPSPEIFRQAIVQAGSSPAKSIMIGDDLHTDVLGAQRSGIDGVYFNPEKLVHSENPTYEITHLKDLKDLL